VRGLPRGWRWSIVLARSSDILEDVKAPNTRITPFYDAVEKLQRFDPRRIDIVKNRETSDHYHLQQADNW
jgi:hypothetical protein